MHGTTTSDGQFVGFMPADHYERIAERRRRRKAETAWLAKENRLRVKAGMETLAGQLTLPGVDDDAPAVEKQGKLF